MAPNGARQCLAWDQPSSGLWMGKSEAIVICFGVFQGCWKSYVWNGNSGTLVFTTNEPDFED